MFKRLIKTKTVFAVGPVNEPVTGQSSAFDAYVNNSSVSLKIIYYSANGHVIFKLLNNCKFIFRLFFQFIRYRPDVIYFTSSRSTQGFVRDFFMVFYASVFDTKIINHLHGADFLSFFNGSNVFLRMLIDWVYKKITVSIVLSNSMKEQYFRYTDSMKLEVVENCYLSTSDHKTVNNEVVDNNTPIRLLYLSNLMCSKGVLDFLSALSLLKINNIPFKAKVVGRFLSDHIMQANELEIEFDRLNNDVAEFMGPMYGHDKNLVLSWADCLVLPSYYPTEAQPICIIEAMASGCYIVSTKHNYIPDLVSSKNGALVEVNNIEEIYKAIADISGDRAKVEKVKSFNRHYARDRFSVNSYVTGLDSIVFNLLS